MKLGSASVSAPILRGASNSMKRPAEDDEQSTPVTKISKRDVKISKFTLIACAKPAKPKPSASVITPKVGEVQKWSNNAQLRTPMPEPPPKKVAAKLSSANLTIGVDIETHDWKEMLGRKGGLGHFGFYTRKNADLSFGRVVQIGWAIHQESKGFTEIKEFYVKPDGFRMAPKGTKFHGISQETVEAEGFPLDYVLIEFMTAVTNVVEAGGRVVIHHLEHDAAIIMHEMGRVGLLHMMPKWEEFAKSGFCTLDPEVGSWVRDCFRMEVNEKIACNMLSLELLSNLLVPDEQRVLAKLHTAACDAHLHVLVYRALVDLAQRAGRRDMLA